MDSLKEDVNDSIVPTPVAVAESPARRNVSSQSDNEPSPQKAPVSCGFYNSFSTSQIEKLQEIVSLIVCSSSSIERDFSTLKFLRINWSSKFYHFCRNFHLQEVED